MLALKAKMSLAPFFNLCIELLPLDYLWSLLIFLFDVLVQKFPTLSWSLSQHRVISSIARPRSICVHSPLPTYGDEDMETHQNCVVCSVTGDILGSPEKRPLNPIKSNLVPGILLVHYYFIEISHTIYMGMEN